MNFINSIITCCQVISQLNEPDSIPVKKINNDTIKITTLNEIVVSASRTNENILQSPVSIVKINSKYFKQSTGPSFFDALENVKGVQMITPSLGFRVINTRGFANTTNVRFAQLVDGMDVQAPHIGAPIGNVLGPSDLDIESVEIIAGTASTLYGMNTINGLANFITKNPFTAQGISMQQKTGLNHIHDENSSAKLFSETSFRWAKLLSSKFAFKLNGTFSKAYDWIADDHTDLNASANNTVNLIGMDNPALDPVNSYGNESSNRRILTLGGKNYVIARTGYFEKEVADYRLQNIKGEAGLYWKPHEQTVLSYSYHFALLNNIYQRSNRFRLQDYLVQQHAFQFKNKVIQVKVYLNRENTGHSFNLRSMAENIEKNFKKDDQWFVDYAQGFNNAVQGGQSILLAHHQARAYADHGRPVPGSVEFTKVLEGLQEINNWDLGAALRVKANLVHAEGQINLTDQWLVSLKKKFGLELLTGFDHRSYIIVPDGNYFINPVIGKEYNNLIYGKTGGFLSLTEKTAKDKLKLGASIRADKNDYFSLTITPRFIAVYSPELKHNFRVSYQKGFRFPSIFEGFSNVNSGGVKRVGGLRIMSHGIFENSYLRASIDAFQAAVNNDVNTTGISKNDAINKNKGLLVKNNYTYLKPEQINSWEAGYKGVLLKSKIFVDADFYYNDYHSFIAQVEVNIPKTNNSDSIAYYLYDKKLQDRYRMWTNSKSNVYNYGGSLGITFQFLKDYTIYANLSLAKLDKKSNKDGLEDGFNTPQWTTNISIGNENVYRNIGFGISYKWQSSYYWQSFLINGQVPAYCALDVKLNYTFPLFPLSFKTGVTNLLNRNYVSYLGGPKIGAFYYSTFTYSFAP